MRSFSGFHECPLGYSFVSATLSDNVSAISAFHSCCIGFNVGDHWIVHSLIPLTWLFCNLTGLHVTIFDGVGVSSTNTSSLIFGNYKFLCRILQTEVLPQNQVLFIDQYAEFALSQLIGPFPKTLHLCTKLHRITLLYASLKKKTPMELQSWPIIWAPSFKYHAIIQQCTDNLINNINRTYRIYPCLFPTFWEKLIHTKQRSQVDGGRSYTVVRFTYRMQDSSIPVYHNQVNAQPKHKLVLQLTLS